MNLTYRLISKEVRARAAASLQEAPDGFYVIFKKNTRSLDQNAKFHAICENIANMGIRWDSEKLSAAEWKIMLIIGHSIATDVPDKAVRGIEGGVVSLRESSASMSVERLSSLIEYSQAFEAKCIEDVLC